MIGSASKPIRVIVVDDSRLMRRLITASLEESDSITVVAQATDTVEARHLIKQHDPDVVTLDVEMPGMNGIEFLEKVMELRPMPVVMVSTLTAAGAEVTLNALRIGAVDAVAKPAAQSELANFASALREKVRVASRARLRRAGKKPIDTPLPRLPAIAAAQASRHQLIAMGASTGGVRAIEQVLEGLPLDTPPILITQHMPAMFTGRFATRLNEWLPHDIAEASDGETLGPGMVRIAPGHSHLCVQRSGSNLVTWLDPSGPISGHRPSVDVLFNSVASLRGTRSVGVILTGMGRDGAAGLRAMRNGGAYCIGQTEDSCVVYGMPGAARELDAVDEELWPAAISARLQSLLTATPNILMTTKSRSF